jgi:hypothetical protein
MGKRDVIISALACGGKMSCRKQAAEFKEPPAIISINSGTGVSTGGGTVKGFRKAAGVYKKNGKGSILDGVLATQKTLEPRRIALVSYLDGWSFIHEILKSKDSDRIDTIIVLEGINTRSTEPWKRYAENGRLWLATTESKHKTSSSVTAARDISSEFAPAGKNAGYNEARDSIPKYITEVILDKSVSIYSKEETPKTKMFHEDPLYGKTFLGKLVVLQYRGKQVQDRTYIQQYVQPRLWRWLRELWKDPTNGIVF